MAEVVHLVSRQPPVPDQRDGVAGLLQRLCAAAARALSASGTGVSVMGKGGVPAVAAASDPASEHIEDLQFLLGEGPCLDAYAARRPVLMPDLTDGATTRWPIYTPAVQDRGVHAIFGFPIQVGAAVLGVFDVFRTHPGHLSREELGQALAFADVAMMTLLDGREQHRSPGSADGLDEVIADRAELFQAQGMVMVQLNVTLAEALVRIRAHAFAEDRHLDDVARDIVARRLRFDQDHS